MAGLRQGIKLPCALVEAMTHIVAHFITCRVGCSSSVLSVCARRRRTAGGFFANWAANMLVQLVAQAFGLLIGATVMDPKAAQVGQGAKR